MSNNRLDTTLSRGTPHEMALPTPRLFVVAKRLRYIVSTLQCGVVLLSFMLVIKESEVSDPALISVPFVFSVSYTLMYVIRLLPQMEKAEEGRKLRIQIIAGILEITLLGALSLIYSHVFSIDIQSSYWWALYVLPVYRLGETAGVLPWVVGLLYSSALIIAGFAIRPSWTANTTGWFVVISEISLLALFTFLLFYMNRSMHLARRASNFWATLSSRHKTSLLDSIVGIRKLLEEVFTTGSRDMLSADWTALWVVETESNEQSLCRPKLRLEYTFERTHGKTPLWQKWLYQQASSGIFTVRGDTILRLSSETEMYLFGTEDSIVDGSSTRVDEQVKRPWVVSRERPEIGEWIVAAIHSQDKGHCVGFLEVGMRWEAEPQERSSIEAWSMVVAEALGQIFGQLHRLKNHHLKEELLELEHTAKDEAELKNHAVLEIEKYTGHPAMIIEYACAADKPQIQSIFGDPGVFGDSSGAGGSGTNRISWLQHQLPEMSRALSRSGNVGECITRKYSLGISELSEHYLIYSLASRGNGIELIMLVNHLPDFTTRDNELLIDLATMLNAAMQRLRAANLPIDYSDASVIRSARSRLEKILEGIREDTNADVVILNEFDESGVPMRDPLWSGRLVHPEYFDQPVIIKGNNPLLDVAHREKPRFSERIQEEPFADPSGTGRNMHGDLRFVTREGIISSVGVPLKAGSQVLGILWANFRTEQQFSFGRRAYYDEIARQLSRVIQIIRMSDAIRMNAVEALVYQARGELHHNVIQQMVSAKSALETAKGWIEEGN